MVLLDTMHGLVLEEVRPKSPSRHRILSPGKAATHARIARKKQEAAERAALPDRGKASNELGRPTTSPQIGSRKEEVTYDLEALTPHWKRVQKALQRMNNSVEESELVQGEEVGVDRMEFSEIDIELRKEMLSRQGRTLHRLVDEHAVHARDATANLDKVDSWMMQAVNKLEQDDDADPFAGSANVRPNATVGQLLNHQTEMGAQLGKVHDKMSAMSVCPAQCSACSLPAPHFPNVCTPVYPLQSPRWSHRGKRERRRKSGAPSSNRSCLLRPRTSRRRSVSCESRR